MPFNFLTELLSRFDKLKRILKDKNVLFNLKIVLISDVLNDKIKYGETGEIIREVDTEKIFVLFVN